MTRRVIRTDKAPAPFQGAPYSQAIEHGGLVFVSGQLGVEPGGNLVEGGIAQQTEQVMQNLSAILEAAGTSLANVVKATIFLSDRSLIAQSKGLRREILGERTPAITIVLTGIYDEAWLLEIEAVAAA